MKSTAPKDFTRTEISGISRASNDESVCKAINHFLRMGLHRDLLNLKGHPNQVLDFQKPRDLKFSEVTRQKLAPCADLENFHHMPSNSGFLQVNQRT